MMGHRLGLRLFIEGIEVPCISASISIAPGAPAAASIQIIATDKALEFWPRTVVHLFFYDFVEAAAYIQGGSTDPDAVGGYDSEDYLATHYKLMFCGELHGIMFGKNVGNRSITLTCVDFSNYWDTTYQYNFNGELLSGHYKAAFLGGNTNLFTSPLGHGTGTIAALLCAKCVSFPDMEGLLAGIVHILEAIGGCYYGNATFKGCNDFCSIAELRLKLLQQVCAAEKDSTTKNLFARKAFNMWMNRQVGSLGQLVTFRGLTQLIMKMIFHECFPNPVAFYKPKIKNLKKKVAFSVGVGKDPRTAKIVKTAMAMLSCTNAALAYLGQMLTSATLPLSLATTLKNNLEQLKKYDGSLMYDKATNVVPGMNTLILQAHTGLRNCLRLICDKGGCFRGPGATAICSSGSTEVDIARATRLETNQEASKELGKTLAALETLLGMKTRHSKEVKYDKVDHLNNQIFRPDIWFAPPPMCNVLFPECYSSFSWSRNYLREVSRLELQLTNEILGDDALFNPRHYAPNITDMRKGIKMQSRQFSRFIMQHELFTGIIPMFEKMTEANLFAMKSKQVNVKGARVGYAQRAVEFIYFKHRFASRQMQAMGRFNPWFVAGFPALLIDKVMDYDKLAVSGLPVDEQLRYLDIVTREGVKPSRAALLKELIPTQYMGHCINLVHNMSQQGGTTQYAFTEARIHRESSEYLGVDRATVSRANGKAMKTAIYAAVPSKKPKEKGRGPRGGIIMKVKDVTDKNKGRYYTLFPLGKGQVRIGDYDDGKWVETDNFTAETGMETHSASWKAWNAVIPAILGGGQPVASPKQQTTATYVGKGEQYRAYLITEYYTKRIREEVDLPIEDAICPPWIWDGWKNLRIGQTYMQFFGTNSIVDVEKFTAADIVETLPGGDTYTAELEAQEGTIWGSQKAEPAETANQFLDRLSGATKGSKKKTKAGTKKKVNKPDPEAGKTPGMAISADRKAQGLALITMEKERTVEASVDYLVRLYSMIRLYNMDVESFLRNYTWRPVATLLEMFGSENLEITKIPDKVITYYVTPKSSFLGANKQLISKTPGKGKIKKTKVIEQGYKVDGVEGFHSRAFSDDSNLFGLVDAKVTRVLGLSVANQATAKKLDVRGTRRQSVRDYVQELTNSRGLLG